jgi:hypothetical protein
MALTLRPTRLQSPAYEGWADYSVYEDGDRIGRLYEDLAVAQAGLTSGGYAG